MHIYVVKRLLYSTSFKERVPLHCMFLLGLLKTFWWTVLWQHDVRESGTSLRRIRTLRWQELMSSSIVGKHTSTDVQTHYIEHTQCTKRYIVASQHNGPKRNRQALRSLSVAEECWAWLLSAPSMLGNARTSTDDSNHTSVCIFTYAMISNITLYGKGQVVEIDSEEKCRNETRSCLVIVPI